MNRRLFLSQSALAASAIPFALHASTPQNAEGKLRQVYEWRCYELTSGGRGRMDDYLSKALIPALNRAGANQVGVCTEMGGAQPEILHVFIVYPSWAEMPKIQDQLTADADYLNAAKSYFETSIASPAYVRYTTSVLHAFTGLPQAIVPEASNRIFELRVYEGNQEDATRRKVKMFNSEELPLFYSTGLHPVFFGEMLAGPYMPCLTYMLVFKDMEEREANWAKFIAHPDWEIMKNKPEYANSVSNIVRVFLQPTAYSQW